MSMETFDIAGTLKWVLGLWLKTDKVFMLEHDGLTWYVDNYCARAVPTSWACVKVPEATAGIVKTISQRVSGTGEVELHDTGNIRKSELKGKPNIQIWATPDGTEVGVREDFAKLLGNTGKLYAAERSPAESMMCIRISGGCPAAVIMPVRIRKEAAT